MKLICELNDEIILGKPGRSSAAPRLTARAIVKNADGLYAVMYAEKFGLYSLPGGGVEDGEDVLAALHREILEETGCNCDSIQELGMVTENRACQNYTQISYYFVVSTTHNPQAIHLTDAEAESNTGLQWHTFDDMVRLISEPEHTTVQRKYLQARDVAALLEYSTWRIKEMDKELIQKTEAFLKDTFHSSPYLQEHRDELDYRLEHSYRVANIGKQIAVAEGFDVTDMVIACLLHDISYCQEMTSREQRMAHGRAAAQIARPFLQDLGLPEDRMNDILYGIAIHVDDVSDFEWKRTPFAETISDADNIDRFDAYRVYEGLEYNKFSKLPLAEKKQLVESRLEQLRKLRDMKLVTKTAAALWQQRVDFYIAFYEKLQMQIARSASIV